MLRLGPDAGLDLFNLIIQRMADPRIYKAQTDE